MSVQRLATALAVAITAFVLYMIAPLSEFWAAIATWWRGRRT